MGLTSSISDRLALIRENIAQAARTSGRSASDIRLVAVSKTHPVSAIEEAIAAGQRDFGENMIQEALPKIASLADAKIAWHFIGHLQTNKTKHIPGNFQWLHSIDNLKTAQRVARVAVERKTTVNAFIEVNVTGDKNKHGVGTNELPTLMEQLLASDLQGMALCGLMALGPYPANESEIRAAFAKVRELRDQTSKQFSLTNFTELSIGMSGDYIEAVKEGATQLRIGTSIFGERDYGAPDVT